MSRNLRPIYLVEPGINPITRRFGLPLVANYPPLALVRLAGQLDDPAVRIVDLRVAGEMRRFLSRLRSEPPAAVCISLTFTSNGDEASAVAAAVRRAAPGALIVLGGSAASEDPDSFTDSDVDLVCWRSGDAALAGLVADLRLHGGPPEAPPGFLHRRDGAWVRGPEAPAPEMDALRPYAWDRIPRRYWRTYFQGFRRTGMSQTSEGCPYDCSFCSVWQVHGRRVSVASLQNVRHDLLSLPPGVRGFFFADDIWMQATEPQRRALYDPLLAWLKDEYLKRRPSIRLTAETRTDLFLRQEQRFAEWIRHGRLRRIFFGVEAVTEEALAGFSKRNTVVHNSVAIRRASSMGARVTAQFVIPLDADEAYFDELERFLQEHRPWIAVANFTIATPLPGTELYRDECRLHPELADRRRVRPPAFSLFCALTPTRLPLPVFYGRVARLYAAANRVRFSWDGVGQGLAALARNPSVLGRLARVPRLVRELGEPRTWMEVHRAVQGDRLMAGPRRQLDKVALRTKLGA